MSDFDKCRQSPTFESANCIFECYSRENPQDHCNCVHKDEHEEKELECTDPKHLDVFALLNPKEDRSPSLFRQCLLKNLKGPAAVECHISSNPREGAVKNATEGTYYRGARSDCRIYTRDEDGNVYFKDLGREEHQGLDEYFYEKAPEKEWYLETKEGQNRMPKPKKTKTILEPIEYYDSRSRNFSGNHDFMALFFNSEDDANIPTSELGPIPKPAENSLRLGCILSIITMSFVVVCVAGFFVKKIFCKDKKKKKHEKNVKKAQVIEVAAEQEPLNPPNPSSANNIE